jgi:hypothetical protein
MENSARVFRVMSKRRQKSAGGRLGEVNYSEMAVFHDSQDNIRQ